MIGQNSTVIGMAISLHNLLLQIDTAIDVFEEGAEGKAQGLL